MREIKFRAWDKENNEMIEWNDEFFYDTSSVTNWSGNFTYINMPLMQFIGLKDKNDKEIYEGDIVKYWGGIAPIVYQGFGFSIKESEDDYFDIHEPNKLEIIGNIYEQPELIKEKQKV